LVWIDPAKQRHKPGPPMDLANMREQGVQHLSFHRYVETGDAL
jgi:hypothetical protein